MYKTTVEVYVNNQNNVDSLNRERKFSNITINTDSGVDSIINGDTVDDADTTFLDTDATFEDIEPKGHDTDREFEDTSTTVLDTGTHHDKEDAHRRDSNATHHHDTSSSSNDTADSLDSDPAVCDTEIDNENVGFNTDSGLNATHLSDTRDDTLGPDVDYMTIRSTGGLRVSLDEHHRHKRGEMSKFVESTVNKRKSCSLPNFLDIDELREMAENYSEMNDCNKTVDSSDLNLSFDELETGPSTPERVYGRGSVASIQVCGKEHIEDPCFICLKDNEIYCAVCVEVHNFHCKEQVKYIPEIPPEMKTKFCSETVRELKIMRERFLKVKAENEAALNRLEDTKKSFIRSVMRYKNTIVQTIDRLEKEALQDMDQVFNAESKRIETRVTQMDREIANIESYLKVLELESEEFEASLVFELQEAAKQVRRDESAIRDFHKSTNEVELNFEPLEELTNLLADFDKLWKVTKRETEVCKFPSPCSCDRSYQYKGAEFEKEVSVRMSGLNFDRDKCRITGCEFLPNGKLLVCDNSNKKIKLFDQKFKFVSAHSLPSLPWDVAIVDDNKAVITVPDRKQLQFIETNNRKILLKNNVQLNKTCWGVSCDRKYIYVSCWSREASEILVLDLAGKFCRFVNIVDNVLLDTPWFLDCFNDSVYVSDWGTYILQCMDTKGTTVSKYRNSYLVGPLGVTHDPEGNVYVCSRDSNTIHQLSPDGQLQQILLTEKDGVKQPLNICHRTSDDKLVVTSWMCDKISVYKLQ